jgi:hypothetical protein
MKAGWSMGARPSDIIASMGILAARNAGLKGAGIELQGEWKDILNQPGSGKVYPTGISFITKNGRVIAVPGTPEHPGRTSTHTASAAGEAPAPDTHELGQSIAVVEMADRVRVGTGLRKGLALEYGVNVAGSRTGPHPGKNYVLQPRPHARPAGKAAKDGMTRAVKFALGSGGKSLGGMGGMGSRRPFGGMERDAKGRFIGRKGG